MAKWIGWKNPRQEELPDEPPKHRAKKDRARWCKGKKGQEHAWGPWEYWGFGGYYKACNTAFRRCTNCGKHSPLKTLHNLGKWHKFEDCLTRKNPPSDLIDVILEAEASLEHDKSH